ncbi:MAG: hypothetical protein P4M02_08505, partial [Clostridia bacterium]|nr:hypothetical protein [Clostridia bacterium]
MKKQLLPLLCLFALLLIPAGCGQNDEGGARAEAQKFMNAFYTVDNAAAEQYANAMQQARRGADSAASTASSGMTGVMTFDVPALDAIGVQLKPLMTAEAFKSMQQDRRYTDNVQYAQQSRSSIKLHSVSLKTTQQLNEYIDFDYT